MKWLVAAGLVVVLTLPALIYTKIQRDNKFTEKCFQHNGVVLSNATGTAKARSYTYVCVKPEIIINIEE